MMSPRNSDTTLSARKYLTAHAMSLLPTCTCTLQFEVASPGRERVNGREALVKRSANEVSSCGNKKQHF